MREPENARNRVSINFEFVVSPVKAQGLVGVVQGPVHPADEVARNTVL